MTDNAGSEILCPNSQRGEWFSAALAAVGPTGHVTATDVAWAICKKNLALLSVRAVRAQSKHSSALPEVLSPKTQHTSQLRRFSAPNNAMQQAGVQEERITRIRRVEGRRGLGAETAGHVLCAALERPSNAPSALSAAAALPLQRCCQLGRRDQLLGGIT
jgi:hypothetical protein